MDHEQSLRNRRSPQPSSGPAQVEQRAPGRRTRTAGLSSRRQGSPSPPPELDPSVMSKARAECAEFIDQAMDVAMRPDLHGEPVEDMPAGGARASVDGDTPPEYNCG